MMLNLGKAPRRPPSSPVICPFFVCFSVPKKVYFCTFFHLKLYSKYNKLVDMNKSMIFKQLILVLTTSVLMFGGHAAAQSVTYTPDTIYKTLFGCDSVLLDANATVYYQDTTIRINHQTTISGQVVTDFINIYQISVGKSYDLKDTVEAKVCPNALPYAFRQNFYSQPGDYWLSSSTQAGCDSAITLLRLKLFEAQRDTVDLSICYGQTSVFYDGIDFTVAGVYDVTRGVDTNNCPIVRTYVVKQYPQMVDTVHTEICPNALPYVFKGNIITASGVYNITQTEPSGCTSLTVLDLIVRPDTNLFDTVDVAVCQAELPYVFDGVNYNTSGSYIINKQNRFGCDSLRIVLNLFVVKPLMDTVSVTLCSESFPYIYDSLHVYNAPGVYFVNKDSNNTCGHFTMLIINSLPSLYDTVNICTPFSSYTFGDTTFTASTLFTYSQTNASGCLDYHTFRLELNTLPVNDTVDVTVCELQLPYVYEGVPYIGAGSYPVTLKNQHGCDSVKRLLRLAVTHNIHVWDTVALTRNKIPYLYHGTAYTESGTYFNIAPAVSETECDTFYTLVLTVDPIYRSNIDTAVCSNTTLTYLDKQITAAGEYTFTYHMDGYDSVITLNVTHYPSYIVDTAYAEVSDFDLPYIFLDSAYYTSGYHSQTFVTENGCDSVVSLYLTIHPAVVNSDTVDRSVCTNELPVIYGDSVLNEAGLYRIRMHTAYAYDSVFFVRLAVKESPTLLLAENAYLCTGGEVTLSAQSTGGVYLWSNGATESSTTVTMSGQYSLTVSNAFDCHASGTVTVTDVTNPPADILGNDRICMGGSVLFQAIGGATFLWDDGTTNNLRTVSPESTTTYTVTVFNTYGCSTTTSKTLVVNPLPTVTLTGNAHICEGESTTFYVSGGMAYYWNTGAHASQITVSNAGSYSVTVTDANQCTNRATVQLVVHNRPVITINGRTKICQGGNTTLLATGANTYSWSTGESNASITTSSTGTYSVIGTDEYGCAASKSVTLTSSPVTASITGTPFFCYGKSTTLTVTGDKFNTYHWFDGSTLESVDISTAGTYSVTVTNADGCQNVLSVSVSEYNNTPPTIDGTPTLCENQTTTLLASGAKSYVWDNGSTQAMITVGVTGTYVVTATNDYGCTATASYTVLVYPSPIVSIVATDTICRNGSAVLTAVSPAAVSYMWGTGQNTSSITVSPTNDYQYSVLVTDEHGCVNSASRKIVVKPLPSLFVNGIASVCQGDTSVLTATGGMTYQWSTGQYGNQLPVTESGIYSVTATGANGCVATAQKQVTVNTLPVAMVTELVEICQGQQALLNASASLDIQYTWSNGTHQNNITVNEAGDYFVTVTNAAGCSRVYHSAVTVYPLPQINVTGTAEICQGESAVLTVSGEDVYQYEWSTGDHSTTTTVSEGGQYFVTATNHYGCTTTASRGVVVHALPEPQINGVMTVCKGQSTTLTATGGVSYAWNTGDVGNSIMVTPTANQSYTVMVSNSFGCTAGATAVVEVNELPTITFSGNTAICAGDSTSVTATGAQTYAWSTGGGNATEVFNAAGSYVVSATDNHNCSNTATVTITVHSNPNVQISGAEYVCFGNMAMLTASGATTYKWSTNETGAAISVSPTAPSTYSVTGYDLNGCHTTAYKSLDVVGLPVVEVSGIKTICAGQSTTLTATGGIIYQWNTNETGNNITVSPAATQSYVVTVTNSYGCVSSLETQVVVNMLPVVSISGETEFCAGDTVSLTADGGVGYLWSTGEQTAQLTVSEAGNYKVTVTDNHSCSQTDSVLVTVNPNPDVKLSVPDYACYGNVVLLSASGANTYLWSTGETSSSISVTPPATTTYSVTGYNAKGCQTTVSKTLNVEMLPSITVDGVKTICAGQSTTLTASGGVSYLWDDGTVSNSITVSPSASRSYVVTVTNALGCSSSMVTNVVVNNLPQVLISGNNVVCAGSTATLTASGGTAYSWSNGTNAPVINVTEAGYYKVTVTNGDGCSASDSIYVTVNANPVVQISGSTYVCAGSIATLTASGASDYVWSTQEVTPSISVSPSSTKTYTVTGSDANGCSMTVSRVMNVEPLPTITIEGSKTICAGQSTTLTATGGVAYQWSTGETINSVVVTPDISQSYVVTVTNAYGCVASSAASVTVNQLPNVSFSGNTTICSGNTTTITAVGALYYLWSTGAQTANVNISADGMYYVTATNSLSCSRRDSVYVKVNPIPNVQIAGENHVCAGSVVTLTASGANIYHWNNGETSEVISISPTANATYSVTGYDTNGCFSTVQKVVNVESNPDLHVLGENTICQGQSTVLTAVGGTSYAWSNGSTTQDITVSPNFNASYTVTAYNAFGCSATNTTVVTVRMLPSIIFNGNTSICQGESTTISVAGATNYVWSTGVTGNSITVTTPGVYKVNATNSQNCVRTDSITVTVFDNPTISVGGASLICQGETAALTASGANTYVWSTGEGGASITVMPQQTSTYSVVGYDANGCSASINKVVNVESAPEAYISGNLSMCHGESTQLTASTAAAYAWSTGDSTATISASEYGVYTVTVSSVNGCQGMASVTVVDNPVPVFFLNAPSTICENTTEVLSVTGENSYVWSTGDTSTQITINTGGVYSLTATNSYGCEQISSIHVAELDAPDLSIDGVTTLCQNDTATLTVNTEATDFVWSTGETTQSVDVVPNNTTYSVTVTGANGCPSTADHHITTFPTYNLTVTGTVCEGQPFSQYGFDIPVADSAGIFTYTRALQTVHGCDSIVNLLLTVSPLPRLDTIIGPPNITNYGSIPYYINNPTEVSSYEWVVSNTHWTLSNATFSNVMLDVTMNGSGTLTARGINGCGYREIHLDLYCNVGIEDYPTQATVTLYPNPVHQSLYVNLENAPEVSAVRLYDEAGRIVYQAGCQDTRLEIDCTRFANGHYTVQFFDEKGRRVESRKIIVNNK